MDKRGQDLSIGTLILIILGIAVLVILIIGFTSGWDFLISKFSIAPGQTLETLAQSCLISGNNGLDLDFCSFKDVTIDGKDQHMNCVDERISAANSGKYERDTPKCNGDENGENIALDGLYSNKKFCATEARKDTDLINNKPCSDELACDKQAKDNLGCPKYCTKDTDADCE